jgi:VanZ family protein
VEQAVWHRKAFLSYVLFMLVLFLLPVPSGPLEETTHLDKAVHFGVFLGFALLFHLDRAAPAGSMLLASAAFAAAIEVIQWLLPYRGSDWWDFAAGTAGGGIGAALVFWSARRRRVSE